MILAGGIIQLILPAKSPLPEHMNSVHLWIHNNLVNDPFVCFPSMHVSLATLPTLLLLDRIKEFNSKLLLFIVLILISLSTITLKEHYFVDMIAGFAMGYLFYKLFKFQAIK
jgi:membrane-associated phospholipid phosphatase